MSADGKIVDAYAEWDDRGSAFRVYLVREDEHGNADLDDAKPMDGSKYIDDGTMEARLHRAAFVACPKDVGQLRSGGGEMGWPREAPAKRVAAAVKKELARAAKGEPGPSDDAIRIVCALMPRKVRA